MTYFWSDDCPSRGPALSHAHLQGCTPESHPGEESGHMMNQCCHCRMLYTPHGPRQEPKPADNIEPVDVAARLRHMGLMPTPEDVAAMSDKDRAEHQDNTPVEPRFANGRWMGDVYVPAELTGKRDGKGRGDLTYRQKSRLWSWKKWVEHLGGDGPT